MTALKDLGCGIYRHPWKTAGYVFTAFSVLFTIIRGVTHFIPGIKIEGIYALGFVITCSIGYGLKKIWKPSEIVIRISNSNTRIEVLFGDLFVQDGIRAIAVSEFFDSTLGKPVSDRSLHGIFLKKYFSGGPESFDKQISDQLQDKPGEVVPSKVEGKTKKYPIGTCAIIKSNEDRYLIFALTAVDPQTCKACADVKMMWDSLSALWKRARIETGGYPLNLPLVGSGLSGLGLPTRDLLNLIILSAITETKAQQITDRIRIILQRDRFEDLDLREIKEHWES